MCAVHLQHLICLTDFPKEMRQRSQLQDVEKWGKNEEILLKRLSFCLLFHSSVFYQVKNVTAKGS